MTNPRPRLRSRRALGAIAIALLATGCADAYQQFFGPKNPPSCPTTQVLFDAEQFTRFRDGPGRDIIDILYEATFEDFPGLCRFDVDKKTGTGSMTVEINAVMRATRGPANRDRTAQLPYFAALTDSSGKVLNKAEFSVAVEFTDNQVSVLVTDRTIELVAPITPETRGIDYSILLGFQLTREQLEYNRRRRAQTGG